MFVCVLVPPTVSLYSVSAGVVLSLLVCHASSSCCSECSSVCVYVIVSYGG